jgi:hypothetical protein
MPCRPDIFSFALAQREAGGRIWIVNSSCGGPLVMSTRTLLGYGRFRRTVARELGVALPRGLDRGAWWPIIRQALAPLHGGCP